MATVRASGAMDGDGRVLDPLLQERIEWDGEVLGAGQPARDPEDAAQGVQRGAERNRRGAHDLAVPSPQR